MRDIHNPSPHEVLHFIAICPLTRFFNLLLTAFGKAFSVRVLVRHGNADLGLDVVHRQIENGALELTHLPHRSPQLVHRVAQLLDAVA